MSRAAKAVSPIPDSERQRVADVVARHLRLVRLAVNRVADRLPWADREDLFGEGVLSLTVCAHLYRYAPSEWGQSEATYYYRCVSHHLWIVAGQRARRGHDHLCLSQLGDADTAPPDPASKWRDHVEAVDGEDWLDRAERLLPESYRGTFRLHFRDGLTQAETARALGHGKDYVHILVRKIAALLRGFCEKGRCA